MKSSFRLNAFQTLVYCLNYNLLVLISFCIGEIDSSHGKPKNDIRRYTRHSGAAGTMHTEGLIGGFEDCVQLVEFLKSLPGYNCRLNSKPDSRGFQLVRREVKTHVRDENWQSIFI